MLSSRSTRSHLYTPPSAPLFAHRIAECLASNRVVRLSLGEDGGKSGGRERTESDRGTIVDGHGVTLTAAKSLARSLAACSSLTHLSICTTRISPSGVKALLEAAAEAPNLHRITVKGGLTCLEGRAVADGLSRLVTEPSGCIDSAATHDDPTNASCPSTTRSAASSRANITSTRSAGQAGMTPRLTRIARGGLAYALENDEPPPAQRKKARRAIPSPRLHALPRPTSPAQPSWLLPRHARAPAPLLRGGKAAVEVLLLPFFLDEVTARSLATAVSRTDRVVKATVKLQVPPRLHSCGICGGGGRVCSALNAQLKDACDRHRARWSAVHAESAVSSPLATPAGVPLPPLTPQEPSAALHRRGQRGQRVATAALTSSALLRSPRTPAGPSVGAMLPRHRRPQHALASPGPPAPKSTPTSAALRRAADHHFHPQHHHHRHDLQQESTGLLPSCDFFTLKATTEDSWSRRRRRNTPPPPPPSRPYSPARWLPRNPSNAARPTNELKGEDTTRETRAHQRTPRTPPDECVRRHVPFQPRDIVSAHAPLRCRSNSSGATSCGTLPTSPTDPSPSPRRPVSPLPASSPSVNPRWRHIAKDRGVAATPAATGIPPPPPPPPRTRGYRTGTRPTEGLRQHLCRDMDDADAEERRAVAVFRQQLSSLTLSSAPIPAFVRVYASPRRHPRRREPVSESTSPSSPTPDATPARETVTGPGRSLSLQTMPSPETPASRHPSPERRGAAPLPGHSSTDGAALRMCSPESRCYVCAMSAANATDADAEATGGGGLVEEESGRLGCRSAEAAPESGAAVRGQLALEPSTAPQRTHSLPPLCWEETVEGETPTDAACPRPRPASLRPPHSPHQTAIFISRREDTTAGDTVQPDDDAPQPRRAFCNVPATAAPESGSQLTIKDIINEAESISYRVSRRVHPVAPPPHSSQSSLPVSPPRPPPSTATATPPQAARNGETAAATMKHMGRCGGLRPSGLTPQPSQRRQPAANVSARSSAKDCDSPFTASSSSASPSGRRRTHNGSPVREYPSLEPTPRRWRCCASPEDAVALCPPFTSALHEGAAASGGGGATPHRRTAFPVPPSPPGVVASGGGQCSALQGASSATGKGTTKPRGSESSLPSAPPTCCDGGAAASLSARALHQLRHCLAALEDELEGYRCRVADVTEQFRRRMSETHCAFAQETASCLSGMKAAVAEVQHAARPAD